MTKGGHTPILNDLKADKCAAVIMGRGLVWLVLTILLFSMLGQSYEVTYSTSEGMAWYDCDDSFASITDSSDTEIANGSDFKIHIDADDYVVFVEDYDKCQGVIPLNGELPNLRPHPNDYFETIQLQALNNCSINCSGFIVTGDLVNDSADVFAVNITESELLIVDLLAASSGLEIEIHFQNSSHEYRLDESFTIPINTSIAHEDARFISLNESGRVVFKITSPSPDTVWALELQSYDASLTTPIDYTTGLSGVGMIPYSLTLDQYQSLEIISSKDVANNVDVNLSYRLIYSDISASNYYDVSVGDWIHGMSNIKHVELIWNCNCRWSSNLEHKTHFDANSDIDAPNFKPLSAKSNNSSVPLILTDGISVDGELTIHMNDYRDILRIETYGWNDSVHRIEVTVEGDIYEMEVTIMEIDQESWDVLNQATSTYSMNEISVSLNVGRGTHFVVIQQFNNSNFGSEISDVINWKIRATTVVVEEGEEPWFPASEEVKEAADIFYILMGFLLISPFVIFYLVVQKEKKFAQIFASKNNRLEWLTNKLDTGEFSKTELSRAIRAVSSLEWEQSLEVWGKPSLRHYTTGIDIAIWSLDQRISDDGHWPLLVGIRPLDCEWSVAGLRFESPSGGEWKIESVEPKLLFRENEIFLDTIHNNSRFFIKAELSGDAASLDVHLSGIVDGKPMASKPSTTFYRSAPLSEE